MPNQVTQFAMRLHAMKLRTGRSYEALAQRVGVSSSTLHRYCRGTVLPPSYAVIARFSQVCGASNEEAAELLRQWILASAGVAPRASRIRRLLTYLLRAARGR
jgi:transcriptional regulator with XRE-family HTH domain